MKTIQVHIINTNTDVHRYLLFKRSQIKLLVLFITFLVVGFQATGARWLLETGNPGYWTGCWSLPFLWWWQHVRGGTWFRNKHLHHLFGFLRFPAHLLRIYCSELREAPFPRKGMENDMPMKRLASPLDVAKAVIFLASSLASFTSGQKIMVTGANPPLL